MAKFHKLDSKELLADVSSSIKELDMYRACREKDLNGSSRLLDYLTHVLTKDRTDGKIRKPSKYLLEMMSERKHLKLKGNLAKLFKYASVAMHDYTKFIKHANGKQATQGWAKQAEDLRDFLKEFRTYLRD